MYYTQIRVSGCLLEMALFAIAGFTAVDWWCGGSDGSDGSDPR